MIPLGSHYMHISLQDEDYGQVIGKWLHFKKGSIVVMRWREEVQRFEEVGESEAVAYRAGVKQYDFDSNLGVYPMETHSQWVGLTNFISSSVIKKLDSSQLIIKDTKPEKEETKE